MYFKVFSNHPSCTYWGLWPPRSALASELCCQGYSAGHRQQSRLASATPLQLLGRATGLFLTAGHSCMPQCQCAGQFPRSNAPSAMMRASSMRAAGRWSIHERFEHGAGTCMRPLSMLCRREVGYVTTLGGRRRYFPHINDPEHDEAAQGATRAAVNTICQVLLSCLHGWCSRPAMLFASQGAMRTASMLPRPCLTLVALRVTSGWRAQPRAVHARIPGLLLSDAGR